MRRYTNYRPRLIKELIYYLCRKFSEFRIHRGDVKAANIQT